MELMFSTGSFVNRCISGYDEQRTLLWMIAIEIYRTIQPNFAQTTVHWNPDEQCVVDPRAHSVHNASLIVGVRSRITLHSENKGGEVVCYWACRRQHASILRVIAS